MVLACNRMMKGENLLLVLTIIGVFIGVGVGVGLNLGKVDLTPRQEAYLIFPGEIFLRMLKMLILPLITSSLINSLAQLDSRTAGRISLVAFIFYLTTTLMAVVTGIVLVITIQPGARDTVPFEIVGGDSNSCKGTTPADTILDLIRNMFPDNIEEAGFQSTKTCIKFVHAINKTKTIDYDKWSAINNETEKEEYLAVPYKVTQSGMNVLGLVVFSLFLGYVINRMGASGDPLRFFFASLEGAMMRMITLVIWLSPIGILFLIAGEVVKMDNLVEELRKLGMYMLTVLGGLFIHACVTLPVLLLVLAGRNPLKYTYGMLQAILTAFGTASSSATMPVTLECCEVNNKIDRRVTRFVIPLGATINMDGTALYEAVAAIYIAQTIGRPMGIGDIIIISMTATLASIGAAGIPQAGLVTMIMVLISVGIDPKYFTLIIPIDWMLDRFRTAVNVHGDSYGAAVVDRLCRQQLSEAQHEMEELPASKGQDNNGYVSTISVPNQDYCVQKL
uniref:Amino acid transporter n=1 Tax=Plectus sambesii TaxID=2011161 RepID=A0A914W0C4_9BILA